MWTPSIEQTREGKEEKNPFEILTAELAGKTRDELTPEQREIEDTYREKCFRDLLQLINDDKVLVHKSPALRNVLEHGVLSNHRQSIKYGEGKYDSDAWQASAEGFGTGILKRFLWIYERYRAGEMTEKDMAQEKEKMIAEFPGVGRERARYFFEKVIPEGFDKGRFKHGEFNHHRLSGKRPSFSEAKLMLKQLKMHEISGYDTISTSNTRYAKKNFVEVVDYNKGNPETHLPNKIHHLSEGIGSTIFFDRPSEENLFALGYHYRPRSEGYMPENDLEENVHDTGVASKIRKETFRSIALENSVYDSSTRTLFLQRNYESGDKWNGKRWLNEEYLSNETLEILKKRQRAGKLTLFDEDLQPLPPIESLSIRKVPYTSGELMVISLYNHSDEELATFSNPENAYKQKEKAAAIIAQCDKDTHPAQLQKLIRKNANQVEEKIDQLIQENHWDWHERYGENKDNQST